VSLTAEQAAEIRRRTGLTQEVFAKRAGLEVWVVRNVENRRKRIDDELERAIRKAGNIAADESIVVPERGTDPDELPPDLAAVEFWNQPVEGGDGAAEVETESVVDYLAFSRRWLKGAAPSGVLDNVKAVRVRRDSMAPDIKHGDVLLVDTASRRPEPGQIFVLRRATGLVVKELRKDGTRWMAHSRNPEDAQKPFQAKLGEDGGDVIAGKVFWRCGKI
jgi:transcriptional regulator with XRE-family HTH domain